MSIEVVSPVPLDKHQVTLALDVLAKRYQPPKYENQYRLVKKRDWPNLTEQFPALLRSMRGVIEAYADIGEIFTTSVGSLCSHLELANAMTRDISHLWTLFLGKFSHCTHKPPRDIRPYFSDANGTPAQFCVRAITVQFLKSDSGIELAVMLIGEHPDVLQDLQNPATNLDPRTIAQSFSQLTVHPNGELTTHYYKPMDIALPHETFLREMQGAPLMPPHKKLYSPSITRDNLNPSMFLNPRVQSERIPMTVHDLEGLVTLLCGYFDEVATCLGSHH